jgi:trimethylamine:corrinoid methyltransferase-like protein
LKALKSGEVFLTKLAERGSWEGWERSGWVGMVERAQADAERILREHLVPPLDPHQDHELDVIMAAAENELVK